MSETKKNPIDPDKVAENPGLLEYGHHVGSAPIKKIDGNAVRNNSLTSMEHQTDIQLDQIKEQIDLLAKQARKIQERKELSHLIYSAHMAFKPEINHVYHLYRKADNSHVLTLIGPNEWGRSKPYEQYLYTVKLLADHTWEVVE